VTLLLKGRCLIRQRLYVSLKGGFERYSLVVRLLYLVLFLIHGIGELNPQITCFGVTGKLTLPCNVARSLGSDCFIPLFRAGKPAKVNVRL